MSTPTEVLVTGQVMQGEEPYVGVLKVRIPEVLRGNDGSVILPSRYTVSPDAAGNFSLMMYAVDDPAWAPQMWAYEIEFRVGSLEYTYLLQPTIVGPNTLGELLPNEPVATYDYAPINHTHNYSPADHTHPGGDHVHDLSAYATDAELAAGLATKSDTGHTHDGGGGATAFYDTADYATPQLAIAAAEAGAGRVWVSEMYTLTAPLVITQPNLEVDGAGWDTGFALANGVNDYAIKFAPAAGVRMDGVRLRNFTVDCNGTNQTAGGAVDAFGAAHCDFTGLRVVRPRDNGIWLHSNNLGGWGHHNSIERCWFNLGVDSGGFGRAVYMSESDENNVERNTIEASGSNLANGAAVYDTGGRQSISFNMFVADPNKPDVEFLVVAGDCVVAGNIFDGGTNSQLRITGDGNRVIGNSFYRVIANKYALRVTGAKNTIALNEFRSSPVVGESQGAIDATGASGVNYRSGNVLVEEGAWGGAVYNGGANELAEVAQSGLTVYDNFLVRNLAQDRGFRSRFGGAIDFEFAGQDAFFSVWQGGDFSGAQRTYLRWWHDLHLARMAGTVQFSTTVHNDAVHEINPDTGVAALGKKNGIENIRFCGRLTTFGAPATGTWAVNDLVIDADGAWLLCTVAGTPGTWVDPLAGAEDAAAAAQATADAAVTPAELTAGLNTRAPIESPTFTGTVGGITKAMVGLGNVDNTSDATKPVSTAQQTALDGKQPLDEDLTAIAALAPADDNVLQRKAGAWASRTPAQLKTDLSLAKGDVGLANVDNTSDANKPVSTATQAAIDALTKIIVLGAADPVPPGTEVGTVIMRTA